MGDKPFARPGTPTGPATACIHSRGGEGCRRESRPATHRGIGIRVEGALRASTDSSHELDEALGALREANGVVARRGLQHSLSVPLGPAQRLLEGLQCTSEPSEHPGQRRRGLRQPRAPPPAGQAGTNANKEKLAGIGQKPGG